MIVLVKFTSGDVFQKKQPQDPVADVELPKHRTEFQCIDMSSIHKERWHDQQRDSMTKFNRIAVFVKRARRGDEREEDVTKQLQGRVQHETSWP